MMTMEEIYANAMRGVSQRSKSNADIIRQIEIDYATRQRKFNESELFFGALGYATAVLVFVLCILM